MSILVRVRRHSDPKGVCNGAAPRPTPLGEPGGRILSMSVLGAASDSSDMWRDGATADVDGELVFVYFSLGISNRSLG